MEAGRYVVHGIIYSNVSTCSIMVEDQRNSLLFSKKEGAAADCAYLLYIL
ncbi:protein of unknown function [Paenibacillus alvei]|uniref:Uncharacterized protein n=1 Tax=Paenibacillus alvei TaxID=44250 RepID=A0A383RIH3_PAEAL|nr:protein of unknown function [Paenibacillus alvei]